MTRGLLVFILAAASVWGQTQDATPTPAKPPATAQPSKPSSPQVVPKPPSTPPAAQTETVSKVALTEPVITIHGICSTPPKRTAAGAAARKTPAGTPAGGPCQTVVTKAQFEKLVDALNSSNQTIPPAMRRNLAQAYVELQAYAQAADKAGIENDPRFLEIMRLVRLRTLSDIYRRNLEEKNRTPAPDEIQAHYNQNLARYEEIKLSRVFIPAKNPSAANKDDWEKKAATTATEIHDRAAKGEDLEKLQKDAYTTLGLTITPPNTTVGTRRRGMLAPQEEQELFALKPGNVSKVEQEPAGYIIYKVESQQTLPLDQVKDEISREIFRQKMEAQIKAVTASVKADFNEQYFGPPNPPPSPLAAPSSVPPGAQPPINPAPKPPTTAPAPPAASPPPQGQAPPK